MTSWRRWLQNGGLRRVRWPSARSATSLWPDEVTLFRAKRRALMGGFTATDEVVTSVPRSSIAEASLERGKVVGGLKIGFADGSSLFEVPRVGNKEADQAVAAMGPDSS